MPNFYDCHLSLRVRETETEKTAIIIPSLFALCTRSKIVMPPAQTFPKISEFIAFNFEFGNWIGSLKRHKLHEMRMDRTACRAEGELEVNSAAKEGWGGGGGYDAHLLLFLYSVWQQPRGK